MKTNIIVSVFPSYLCSQNCKFCYLHNCHNADLLDLQVLQQRLNEIQQYFNIHKFNLYGGEITLLLDEYLTDLNKVLDNYDVDNYISTNLYNIDKLKIFNSDKCKISTSLNEERPDYEYIRDVLKNNLLQREITVLSMITPSIVNKDPHEVLLSYNGLHIKNISFIKYYPSINTGDVFNISQDIYEQTLINLIDTYLHNKDQYDFGINTISGVEMCIKRKYPIATNDQCIRIGPDGKLGAIYYNKDNLEYFKWYDNIEDYIKDCKEERANYYNKCGFCKYYSNCWTEHITNEKCDGCKKLLQYVQDYLDE